jgi:hypothetical protein
MIKYTSNHRNTQVTTSNHRIAIPILQGAKQTLGAEACEEEGIDVEHDGTEVRFFCFVLNAKPEDGSDLIYKSKITRKTVSISIIILVRHTQGKHNGRDTVNRELR